MDELPLKRRFLDYATRDCRPPPARTSHPGRSFNVLEPARIRAHGNWWVTTRTPILGGSTRCRVD